MTEGAKKNYQKAEVLARLFGKTTRRIQQLTSDGILPTEETPQGRRYDLLPTISRYIKYLEEKASRGTSEAMAEKMEKKLDAEIKWKKAKADKAQLELDELKGKMHRSEDVEMRTNEMVFTFRSILLALPGRVAMDLATLNTAPEVSAYLSRHVATILDEVASHEYDPEKYAALVREREGWDDKEAEYDDEDEED